MRGKIVDFHTHAFPEKIAGKAVEQLNSHYNIPVPYSGDLSSLLSYAKVAGVGKIVLHAAATHAGQVEITNDWIAGVASQEVVGFGSLHPDYQNYIVELDRMQQLGLTGIKFHSEFQGFDIDDPRMWPIYEAIEDRFLIMFHLGDVKSRASAPCRLARVLDAFPKLKVVGAHLGGYSCWQEAREFLLGRDIYLDTSSALWVLTPGEARDIIRSHGVDRILFGSDYPVSSPQDELIRLESLELTDEEMEKILWRNADKLLARFQRIVVE